MDLQTYTLDTPPSRDRVAPPRQATTRDAFAAPLRWTLTCPANHPRTRRRRLSRCLRSLDALARVSRAVNVAHANAIQRLRHSRRARSHSRRRRRRTATTDGDGAVFRAPAPDESHARMPAQRRECDGDLARAATRMNDEKHARCVARECVRRRRSGAR